MTLIVTECDVSVYQSIIPSRAVLVNAIRPHLYIHGSPSGTVKVEIQNSSGTMLYESAAATITSLKTQTYAHKYLTFEVPGGLEKDTTYRIAVICGGGYTYSDSAFVGVCLDYENTKTNLGYTVSEPIQAPLDIEIWERKTV